MEVSNMIGRAVILLAMLLASIFAAAAQTPSPYAAQEQRAIKALSNAEMRDLAEGRAGFPSSAGRQNRRTSGRAARGPP